MEASARPTASGDQLVARAEALLAAHGAGEPLLLPNAWDAASARAVAVTVFADLNGNGIRDANEPFAPNVAVSLDLNGDGTADRTASTDANAA